MSVNEKMTAIADAIRSKTGGTDALTLDAMAAEIPKVYDAATDAFWDAFTKSGNRTFYEYAFRQTAFEYIRPPKKIVPSGCRSLSMFHDAKELKVIEKAYFDLSSVTATTAANTGGHYNTFQHCDKLEEIEDVGLPAGGYYMTFAYCYKLYTIAVLRVTADVKFTAAFSGCNSLENITIDGVIGQNGLNVSWSPLTRESLLSIIDALETKTDGGSWTITLGSDNAAKLTAEEREIVDAKGWTLA